MRRLSRRSVLGYLAVLPFASATASAATTKPFVTVDVDVTAGGMSEWAYVIHGGTGAVLRGSVASRFISVKEARRQLLGRFSAEPKREPTVTRMSHRAAAMLGGAVCNHDPIAPGQDVNLPKVELGGHRGGHGLADGAERADVLVETSRIQDQSGADLLSLSQHPDSDSFAIGGDPDVEA